MTADHGVTNEETPFGQPPGPFSGDAGTLSYPDGRRVTGSFSIEHGLEGLRLLCTHDQVDWFVSEALGFGATPDSFVAELPNGDKLRVEGEFMVAPESASRNGVVLAVYDCTGPPGLVFTGKEERLESGTMFFNLTNLMVDGQFAKRYGLDWRRDTLSKKFQVQTVTVGIKRKWVPTVSSRSVFHLRTWRDIPYFPLCRNE